MTGPAAETAANRDADELVVAHLGLTRALARRFARRGEPLEDLEQVAAAELVRASRAFDPERGVSFVTYATTCVVGVLKRHYRDRGWWMRAPRRVSELYLRIGEAREVLGQRLGRAPTIPELARWLEVADEDVVEALEAGGSYRPVALEAPTGRDGGTLADLLADDADPATEATDRAQLRASLRTLSSAERRLVSRYFIDEAPQRVIAAELGVSQMHVSRQLSRLLARLRSAALAEAPGHPATGGSL